MARVTGWETKLLDVVERHAASPFAWGVSDCFTFPLEGIVAVIGRDPWPGLHEYDSQLGAARCLVALGFKNLGDVWASKFAEVHHSSAGRGDVAVIADNGNLCGALFVGAGLVGKTESGIVRLPRDLAVRSFRVT